MTALLLRGVPEFSLSALPMILLTILIIVVFAALVWFIISKFPEPVQSWAKWVAIVLGGILLLWFLISLVT